MPITLKSTKNDVFLSGVKCLTYGQAGAGKTSLIPTMPKPIILSAEGGLLSISDHDLPFIEISSMADLREAYTWLVKSKEAAEFQSVALDSISEIAEVVLYSEKKVAKDPRQAYGAMQESLTDLVRAFRDIPGKNVLFTAKLEKSQDEMGRILYAPSMPGNKTGQLLPYFFDLVMALRVEKDNEGYPIRTLQCQPDGLWLAKDRSGKLDQWEDPDLGAVFKKIGGKKGA
jgi:phage nucleotide-binding protein